MLDTNAISAWAAGDAALLRVLSNDRFWHVPVIALGEFLFGASAIFPLHFRITVKRKLWASRTTAVAGRACKPSSHGTTTFERFISPSGR